MDSQRIRLAGSKEDMPRDIVKKRFEEWKQILRSWERTRQVRSRGIVKIGSEVHWASLNASS
jgi:hypothetical protein